MPGLDGENAADTADLAGDSSTPGAAAPAAQADAGPAAGPPADGGATAGAPAPKVDPDRAAYDRLVAAAEQQANGQTAPAVDPGRGDSTEKPTGQAVVSHDGLDPKGLATLKRSGLWVPAATWNKLPAETQAGLLERADQRIRQAGRASQRLGQRQQQRNNAARQPARGTRAGGVAPTPAHGFDDVTQLDGGGHDELDDDSFLDPFGSAADDDAEQQTGFDDADEDQIDPRDQQAGVGAGRPGQASRQQRGARQQAAPQQQDGEDLDALLVDYFGDEVGGKVKAKFNAQAGQLAQQQAVIQQLQAQIYGPQEREAFGALTKALGRPLNTHEQRQIKGLASEHWHVSQRTGEGISWGDAIARAGQQIQNPDIKLQVQQELLDKRKRSLAGSPVRPSQSTNGRADRPVTKDERDRAIFEHLQNGKGPKGARAAAVYGA